MTKNCSFSGCTDNQAAKDLCMGHYLQKRNGKELKPKRKKVERDTPKTYRVKPRLKKCSVEKCEDRFFSSEMCRHHYHMMYTYGLTKEEISSLPDSCEVCSSKVRLVIDHDHITGRFRARLCSRCNNNVGQIERGRSVSYEPYTSYLEQFEI